MESSSPPVSPLKTWRANLPQEVKRMTSTSKTRSKKTGTPKKKKSPVVEIPLAAGVQSRDIIPASSRQTLTSVRNSPLAHSTIGDHELKLLKRLDSTESESEYISAYNDFRKNLLKKADPIKVVKISRTKKNIAKLKMAAKMAGSKNLTFFSKAELAFSPLNPHNQKNTSALMKKIRQMKLKTGFVDADDCSVDTDELNEPIPYDESMDENKEKEIEKKFKYVVGEQIESPFDMDNPVATIEGNSRNKKTGKSLSMQELRRKGEVRNAQSLRRRREREAKKLSEEKNANASNDHKHKEKKKAQQASPEKEGKLPKRLRSKCETKYKELMEAPPRASEKSWLRLKAKEKLQMEKESITITGCLHSPSPSKLALNHSSVETFEPGPESSLESTHGPNNRVFHCMDPGSGDLISGDAMLYELERDGLFTVDDLEELSGSTDSDEMLDDGTDAGLFNTLDLLELNDSESLSKDQAQDLDAGQEMKSPDEVLATGVGALLFSNFRREGVTIRPASAGLGGVSQASIRHAHKSPEKQDLYSYHARYCVDIDKRPKSANTAPHSRSSADFPNTREIPNHVQKKRLVLNRHHPAEVWIS